MALFEQPHRRFNPLTGEWVLVSPHRTKRPWEGQVEKGQPDLRPEHDPTCKLCPGNERASGTRNPAYTSTFVFDNDFSALLPCSESASSPADELFVARSERGLCRVICFSPRHDLTLSLMDAGSVRRVVDLWDTQYREIGALDYISYVQIFENRGAMMGCSNPHPHGQIWANETVPDLPLKEDACQRAYFARHGSHLLIDYVRRELDAGDRVVFENQSFVALVPYWAIWPFETMILPKSAAPNTSTLSDPQLDDLADAVRRMSIRFDNLFTTSFPYSMGIHQSPTDKGDYTHWCLHLHYLPPLLRSATIRKFMVGYELLAMPQRDITPEQSAQRLRASSENHYTLDSAGKAAGVLR